MNGGHVKHWTGTDLDRANELLRIAGEVKGSSETPASPAQVAAALRALGELDSEIVEAIAEMVGDTDRDARLRLLRAVTADPPGRADTGAVMGQRIAQRLEDARAAAEGYRELLADGAGESALQEHIQAHPWLLGLDYVRVRPKHLVPRGELDFILDRYDGFHDLLELKSPQDPIIEAPTAIDGVPPSASQFYVSRDLANALAQVHVYRDVLTTDAATVERLYGLRESRDPLLIVVIGQASALPEHRLRVLRNLNLSLHRVAIVPYDILLERATTVLDNVERHLTAADADATDPDEAAA